MSLKKRLLARLRDKHIVVSVTMLFVMSMVMTGFTTTNHVTIDVDGQTFNVDTVNRTPAAILRQAGINMNEQDTFDMSEDSNKLHITVHRAVPVILDYNGERREVMTGCQNVGELLAEFGYVGNGYISDVSLETPIIEGLEIKVKDAPKPVVPQNVVHTNEGARQYSSVMVMEATAYLPSDGGGSGITATGIAARHGVIAVDPNVIPLGTRVYIPGYGVAIAADTGGAIRGNKVDVCVEDYGSAMQFGRRDVEVYILN